MQINFIVQEAAQKDSLNICNPTTNGHGRKQHPFAKLETFALKTFVQTCRRHISFDFSVAALVILIMAYQ